MRHVIICIAAIAVQIATGTLQEACSIVQHGAVGDNHTVNTQAIIAAIGNCSRVIVPPGKFLTDSFNLTSDRELYLERGAQLLGRQNVEDYRKVRAIYGAGFIYNAMISAYNATNIRIIGADRENSIINGQGWRFYVDRLARKGYQKGPRLIELVFCNNVYIANLTASYSARWHIHAVWSRNVHGTNLTITSPRDIGGTDGFDPAGCQNCSLTDSLIDVGDDAISVKAPPPWEKHWAPFPCAGVYIGRVHLVARNFAIGAHCQAGIRDVLFEDSSIGSAIDVTSAWAIKIKCGDGFPSVVENIVMRNLKLGIIHAWRRYPKNVGIGFIISLAYGEDADDELLLEGTPGVHPLVRNVTLENVSAVSCQQAGSLHGYEGRFLQDIVLRNVTLPKASPWHCAFVNASNSVASSVTPPLDLLACQKVFQH